MDRGDLNPFHGGGDPIDAMAHWGIAMTLFQPLWPTRPDAETLRRGREHVRKAKEIGLATKRERDLVEGAATNRAGVEEAREFVGGDLR